MKINAKKLSFFILLGMLSALVLSGCGAFSAPVAQPTQSFSADTLVEDESVISEGKIVPRDDKVLYFSSPGKVAEILVKKGDLVAEGQVLARLGERQQVEASLAAAKLELESSQQAYDDLLRTAGLASAGAWQSLVEARNAVLVAQADWDEVDTQSYQDDIDDAEIDVRDAKEDLDDAQEDFDKYKDLEEDNSLRKQYEDDLDEAKKDYNETVRERDQLVNDRDRAQATLDQAVAAQAEVQRTYDNSLNGPDPDKLALAEARLSNAKAQVSAAEAALERLELKAPFAGQVVDINIVPNEQLGQNTWAFVLADFGEWYIETNDLTELEVVNIAEGQAVSVIPDALPELELPGTVVEISNMSTEKGGDVLYQVRIMLNETDPRLRWGMTVEVHFTP